MAETANNIQIAKSSVDACRYVLARKLEELLGNYRYLFQFYSYVELKSDLYLCVFRLIYINVGTH